MEIYSFKCYRIRSVNQLIFQSFFKNSYFSFSIQFKILVKKVKNLEKKI